MRLTIWETVYIKRSTHQFCDLLAFYVLFQLIFLVRLSIYFRDLSLNFGIPNCLLYICPPFSDLYLFVLESHGAGLRSSNSLLRYHHPSLDPIVPVFLRSLSSYPRPLHSTLIYGPDSGYSKSSMSFPRFRLFSEISPFLSDSNSSYIHDLSTLFWDLSFNLLSSLQSLLTLFWGPSLSFSDISETFQSLQEIYCTNTCFHIWCNEDYPIRLELC